jgi:hypothetical protein
MTRKIHYVNTWWNFPKVIYGGTDMNMIELSTTGEPQSRKRGNDEAGEITRRKAATR